MICAVLDFVGAETEVREESLGGTVWIGLCIPEGAMHLDLCRRSCINGATDSDSVRIVVSYLHCVNEDDITAPKVRREYAGS